MKHMIAKKANSNNETIAYAIGSGTPVANAYNLKLAALNDAEDGKFEKLDKLRVDNVLNMMQIEHYLPNYEDYLNWAQAKYQHLMILPE